MSNNEEDRATLYELVGQEMADQLLTPPWPYGKRPTIVQPEDLPIASRTGNAQIASEKKCTDYEYAGH